MSTHRVCCCGDLQSPCYTGLTARVCVADGQPTQVVTNSNTGQICQLQLTYRVESGLDTPDPRVLEFEASGIIGRAVTDNLAATVSTAEYDLIVSTYGLSQFDTVFVVPQKTRIVMNGQGVNASHIGFSAWTIVKNDGLIFDYFPQPLDGVSVNGEPALNSNLPWRTEARFVAGTSQPCGEFDFGFGSVQTLTATATGRLAQSQLQSTRFGEVSDVSTMTTRLVPLLPYPTYLPGYTGPALCTPVPGVQAVNANAAAIEIAQANDPLRTCRGCGG